MTSTTLSTTGRRDLVKHEATIEAGLSTFLAVGAALTAIRDGKVLPHAPCATRRQSFLRVPVSASFFRAATRTCARRGNPGFLSVKRSQ